MAGMIPGDLTPAERLKRAGKAFEDAWHPRPALAQLSWDIPKPLVRAVATLMRSLSCGFALSPERRRSFLASMIPGLSSEQLDRLAAADPKDLRDDFDFERSPEFYRAYNELTAAREARIAALKPSRALVELVGRRPKEHYLSMIHAARTYYGHPLPELALPDIAKSLGVELEQLRVLVSRPAEEWEEQ